MRLVTYTDGERLSTGALLGDHLVDLPELCAAPVEMSALLAGRSALEAARQALGRLTHSEEISRFPSLEKVHLLPPVPRPGKIIGIGLNYPAAGSPAERPPFPVLFERNAGSLIGPGSPIRLPRFANQVVIECELVLVIGQGGKDIPQEAAWEALAGYTLANDVTARDLEQRSSQWTTGKLLDAFLPLGPAIVTPDEVPGVEQGQPARIRSWINGSLVQDGSTADMLYSPAELVAYISGLITLNPGDLILTGSPKRLGEAAAPVVYLQPGDQVRLEVAGVGILENGVEGAQHV